MAGQKLRILVRRFPTSSVMENSSDAKSPLGERTAKSISYVPQSSLKGIIIFDYIIVGAGSAGCVPAHRLTANPRTTVLLLEAGGADRTRVGERHLSIWIAFFAPHKGRLIL
jgi:hypothetical protein